MFCLFSSQLISGQFVDTIQFAFKDLPADLQNPLTGFYLYGPVETPRISFPSTLEYLAVPLKNVVVGQDRYTWSSFEQQVLRVSRNGRQAIVRFYLDYPGLPSAIPDFLIRDGLQTKAYDQNGNCATCSRLPDYSNARLTQTLLAFIRAFGARYNGDRRIGIVQLGLVGFWGEWHTWPLQYNAQTFPSTQVLADIIKTYRAAFPDTFLQIGINVASLQVYNDHSEASSLKNMSIGYSDDSIMSSYYESYIKPILDNSGTALTYTRAIIGGEIFPPVQNCIFKNPSCVGSLPQLLATLRTYRTSIALCQRLYNTALDPDEQRTALALAKSMGYRYYIDRVNVQMFSRMTRLTVTVVNNGLTKSYFDLYLGVDVEHTCYFVTKNLHDLLPDATRNFSIDMPFSAPRLPFHARFFLHAPFKVMPSQYLYLSNEGINIHGDLYFTINPRASVALPWMKRSDVI